MQVIDVKELLFVERKVHNYDLTSPNMVSKTYNSAERLVFQFGTDISG